MSADCKLIIQHLGKNGCPVCRIIEKVEFMLAINLQLEIGEPEKLYL